MVNKLLNYEIIYIYIILYYIYININHIVMLFMLFYFKGGLL